MTGRFVERRGWGGFSFFDSAKVLQKIGWIKRDDAKRFEIISYVLECHFFHKDFCPQLNK